MVAVSQNQIATVMSDGPFRLRGANITPGQGVPSWPVIPGDTIRAGDAPVTLTFQDGSTVTIAPGSSARVELTTQGPLFRLEDCGTAHYVLKTLESIKLFTKSDAISSGDLVGDLQLCTPPVAKGWWTAGHTTAVLLGAGGAAGLGVGLKKKSKD